MRSSFCGFALYLLLAVLLCGWPFCVSAKPANFTENPQLPFPNGAHALDGSFVVNIGELRVNITNYGLIGSRYSGGYTYSHAASGEWPGGSGNEYLWGAGIWIGGRIGGRVAVTTGQFEEELFPKAKLVDTIYESQGGIQLRPQKNVLQTGMRLPSANADDDFDGLFDEDMLNGKDDDGDGKVDEDFGQLGDQMFTCTMYDNLPLIQEVRPEHLPQGLKVVQRAFGWDRDQPENIVGLDFKITNVGFNKITELYLGFYVDCDIQNRSSGDNQPDDMAGSFSGIVRGVDNKFYPVELGYMWDAARENPLPGYFGVQLVNHTVAFDGVTAPFLPKITSFKSFSTSASVNQGGEPLSDPDRYFLMSRNTKDRNSREGEEGDLKFLISSGPFASLDVGESLDYQLAMVVGNGFEGMLTNATEASRLYAGRWFDEDNNWGTGQSGRETLVCLGDYPTPAVGGDPILGHRLNFMDNSCAGDFPIMFQDVVHSENLEPDGNGNLCVWVNMDNCSECIRTMGVECDPERYHYFRGRYHYWWYPQYYTGIWGRETHYPWTIVSETPPLAPLTRVQALDRGVELIWDNRSEYVPDILSGILDFESYRIWRVNNWVPPGGMSDQSAPPNVEWSMVAEFDLVNEIPSGIGGSTNSRSLGKNTGLENIIYNPTCLTDPIFSNLAEAIQTLVDSDPQNYLFSFPPIRLRNGKVSPGMESFVGSEAYPDVLDTFFAVASREPNPEENILPKEPTRYYHYIDTDLHNNFDYYYAVVARDHKLTWDGENYVPSGFGIEEDPSNHLSMVKPRPEAQSVAQREKMGVNIYVYPNPATHEALAEFQSREPSTLNPTGVRIAFNNLPLAHNTIRIFTLAGDLVQTLSHNGHTEGGSAFWDLISRNGQEINSDIYLFTVHSQENGFEPFRGKFVVIR